MGALTPMSGSASRCWLVTGANGFLGTALVERLLTEQAVDPQGVAALRLLVRPGSRRERLDAVLARYPDAAVQVCVGGIDTPEAAADLTRDVELVFHLAASMSGRVAELFASTVGATRTLLEGMQSAAPQARLLLVSSFGVYDSAALAPGARLDEDVALEPFPARRDPYSHAKLAQEETARSWVRRHGLRLAVARPGVIYGPGGPAISSRVGFVLGPVFLHLGARNPLPLTYVDNCADALLAIARHAPFEGEAYNVVDDELLDAAGYLRHWRRAVKSVPVVRLPWIGVRGMAWLVATAHRLSRGRFPLLTSPYRARATWRPQTYSNARLRALGWSPRVPLEQALPRAR